ncbi:MAG: PilN domain-containing protein [Desulfobacter sp.]|nr:MAG: PilN domain-containing protein [Desulfobacter sp.]|eukprot:Anaeramoba_ignava/a1237_51.p2 GENE.a1237_51~~a1237_51.p2  ORF type:complete len:195 (-),score=11.26 a1237_51:1504-2088(-)
MIRINLLPFRLARKKENIRRQVSIFLLSLLLIGVALFWLTRTVDTQINTIQNRIAAVQAETKKYQAKAKRVTEIKKKLKILNEKLKVVSSLKSKRDEQQVLLEEMADRIVKDRMWIESMNADGKSVVVTGVAYDNPTIADFMRHLEKSPLFQNVDLRRSRLRDFQGGVQLKAFELVCYKKQAAPEEPPEEKGKK